MTGPAGSPPPGLRTVPVPVPGATRLVLVRHGEAVCNVAGVLGGHRGCTGLTPRGVAQAEALRSRLERTGELGAVGALYASVLPRAVETARIIEPAFHALREGAPLEVVEDCDLCEMHPGEGDGLTWDEFVERFGVPGWDDDPDQALAPGGESWTGFVARAAAGLQRVAGAHPGEMVVVVCHGGVIEAAMTTFLPFDGLPRRRSWMRTEHASLTRFERPAGGTDWVLYGYNDVTQPQQA
jgi:probable phosphoglycerate mutase